MEESDNSPRTGKAEKDWTQGNLLANVLTLSWPMVLSNTLIMLGPVLDMVWVGRLGAVAMAAIASGGISVGLVVTAVMGLAMGTRAMIARFVGAGETKGANHVAQQSLFIALVFSIGMAAVGFFLAANYLKILGLSVEVVTVGAPYVRFTFIGSAAIAFRMMAEAILQASGDTVTPMWASFIYIGARVVLSPFLIFGTEMFAWWILPGLGITGAAVAMTAAHGVAMVIMLWVLFRGRSRLRLTLKGFRLDPRTMWRITKIGLPALISMIQQNLYQLVLVRLMAPFGTVAVAAHGLLQRVEGLIIMPAMAVGMGSGVLVGQNLGAKKTERATKSVWLAFIVLESFIILCSLAIYLWPGAVVRVFNSEPDMIATAGSYLRIAIAGFVAVGFWMVFMQSLNGAGDTIPPMVLSVVSVWLVGLPLAILLPRISELGAYGVRWGIAFSIIANGVVQMAYFLTGRWKRKKV